MGITVLKVSEQKNLRQKEGGCCLSEKELLTYPDVAKLLGICTSSAYNLHYRFPDFPVVKLSERTHVIPRALLMDWLAIHAGDGSLRNKKAAVAAKQSIDGVDK